MASWSRAWFRLDRPVGLLAGLGGAATSVALALVLVPARDWLGNTNVAMLLVGVVIAAAAMGGRSAGVATALVAALTFNAAHTIPYGTLVVEDRRDAITTVLVALVGVGVGELTHRRLAAARQARRRDYAISRLHRIGELTHRAGSVADVIGAIEDEIGAELGLGSVDFELGPPQKLRPQLRHNAVLEAATGSRATASTCWCSPGRSQWDTSSCGPDRRPSSPTPAAWRRSRWQISSGRSSPGPTAWPREPRRSMRTRGGKLDAFLSAASRSGW